MLSGIRGPSRSGSMRTRQERTMKHRIVVLGAGYAGAFSAGYLARQLHSDDFEITVVNAEPDFVERLRLHQLAAGQDLRHRPLAEVFAGTGIRLRVARVINVDVEHRTVTVTDGEGIDRLEYDTLLYALGSTAADHGVPGVDEHAFHVAARPSALRLRARLDEVGEDGKVLVVGGNLTAIEAATEIAESRPGLRVSLATSGELGGWLGTKARRHLLRAFDRFGITVHEHTTIERVEEAAAIAADGTAFASDATVWAAGFAVHPIAAASGLAVEPNGQITVDHQMRSVSHPDVYAAGDSVFVIGDNGLPYPMSCASAGPTSKQAIAAIIGDRTGRKIAPASLSHIGNHISLGRKDGIFQLVDGDAQSKPGALRGRNAARVKSAILDIAAWSVSHPTVGKASHKYRLATTRERSPHVVAG
jgi:NADH dehydrogenase